MKTHCCVSEFVTKTLSLFTTFKTSYKRYPMGIETVKNIEVLKISHNFHICVIIPYL